MISWYEWQIFDVCINDVLSWRFHVQHVIQIFFIILSLQLKWMKWASHGEIGKVLLQSQGIVLAFKRNYAVNWKLWLWRGTATLTNKPSLEQKDVLDPISIGSFKFSLIWIDFAKNPILQLDTYSLEIAKQCFAAWNTH